MATNKERREQAREERHVDLEAEAGRGGATPAADARSALIAIFGAGWLRSSPVHDRGQPVGLGLRRRTDGSIAGADRDRTPQLRRRPAGRQHARRHWDAKVVDHRVRRPPVHRSAAGCFVRAGDPRSSIDEQIKPGDAEHRSSRTARSIGPQSEGAAKACAGRRRAGSLLAARSRSSTPTSGDRQLPLRDRWSSSIRSPRRPAVRISSRSTPSGPTRRSIVRWPAGQERWRRAWTSTARRRLVVDGPERVEDRGRGDARRARSRRSKRSARARYRGAVHGPDGHRHSPRAVRASTARAAKRALKIVLALTAAFLVAEVVGGMRRRQPRAACRRRPHALRRPLARRRAVRRLARRAGPAARSRTFGYPPRRDPRGALQRRHAGRDLDLDLRRGGDPLRRPARRRGAG